MFFILDLIEINLLFDQINTFLSSDIQFFFYSLPLNKSILISKLTTIAILINSNPIAIWGEGNTI